MKDHIDKDAEVKIDYWSGLNGMKADFPKLFFEKSGKKGENLKQRDRVIMVFKAWLRGTKNHTQNTYKMSNAP